MKTLKKTKSNCYQFIEGDNLITMHNSKLVKAQMLLECVVLHCDEMGFSPDEINRVKLVIDELSAEISEKRDLNH